MDNNFNNQQLAPKNKKSIIAIMSLLLGILNIIAMFAIALSPYFTLLGNKAEKKLVGMFFIITIIALVFGIIGFGSARKKTAIAGILFAIINLFGVLYALLSLFARST